MRVIKAISGISTAIQSTMTSLHQNRPLVEFSKTKEYTIKIANTLQEREAVFHLGYQIYLEKGFVKSNSQEWLIQPYDADPQTVILIVQDKNKNIAGSVTLVFNESSRLPAEKIYGPEINALKAKGEKLVELSRLIISPKFRNSKEILLLLFNYLAIYVFHVKKYTSLVVEVNPRHKEYYKSLLNFDEIGGEKACPLVENAPAVLLQLPLNRFHAEVIRCKRQNPTDKKERSLFTFFLNQDQENLVAYYLQKQATPMSNEEKQYFGFTQTNRQLAVAR